MKIIIIDNNTIIASRIDSMVSEHKTWSIVIPESENIDLEYLLNKEIWNLNVIEDCTFIINLHLKSNGSKRFIAAGLTIYQYLLKILRKYLNNKHFIFISPVNSLNMKKLNKFSLIITYFPIIPLNFTKNDLYDSLNQETFRLNIDSFNFMIGWILNRPKPNLPKALWNKSILLIDDEYEFWIMPFKEIFGKQILIERIDSSKKYYRDILIDSNLVKWQAELTSIINNTAIVICDLYLTENHETEFRSSLTNIENISGYKIFKVLRDNYKFIPILIHSSSSRIWNYKLFDISGADDWCVKVQKIDEKESELRQYYSEFETIITNLTSDLYTNIQILWNKFIDLKRKHNFNHYWWYKELAKNKNDLMVDSIMGLLENSFILLRHYLSERNKFNAFKTDNYSSPNDIDNFFSLGIISNLAKISEWTVTDGTYVSNESSISNQIVNEAFYFIYILRNDATHTTSFKYFDLEDVLICLYYMVENLSHINNECERKPFKPKVIIKKPPEESANESIQLSKSNDKTFYHYITWYRNKSSKKPLVAHQLVYKKIIHVLQDKAQNRENWNRFVNSLNNTYFGFKENEKNSLGWNIEIQPKYSLISIPKDIWKNITV